MTQSAFEPQNLLEHALVAAAADPAARPRFMELLLESQILIVPAGDRPKVKDGKLVEDSSLSLALVQYDDRQFIPFFTSEARLPSGTKYLSMKASDLFGMSKGQNLVMNPGVGYGKEFYPNEIAALLDGSYFRPLETHTVKEKTSVLIGQPAERPEELIDALSRLYKKIPGVNAAYLACCHNPAQDKKAGLLIVLDVDSETTMQRASSESGIVIQSCAELQDRVDITRFRKDGLGSYFIESDISPFYERK